MNRINVVGTSGSGKSTFSRKLANRLNYPYLEMDALYWKADWQEPSDEEFFALLDKQLANEYWVLDGNYNRTAPIKWANVNTVIWVDYSYTRTVYQAVKRAFIRCITRKEIWPGTGNVETFKKSFFSQDSVILWTLKTYKSNRRRYQRLIENPDYQHIKFIRITSPRMATAYIDELIL